jgi:CelD/BcsL family acetyltransferase involved in cellulose biosynthesis
MNVLVRRTQEAAPIESAPAGAPISRRVDRLTRVSSRQTSTGLTVEVLGSLDALAAAKPDYERLQALTGNALPFALHDWHLAWCRHFLVANPHIESTMMIHVLRNQDRECVGVVPLIGTRRRIGPVNISSVDLLGADPAITEIRGVLVRSGYESRAAWAVQKELQRRGAFSWVQWNGISGVFGETLAIGGELQWHEPLLDYVLDLPPSWEELRARMKRNLRESIRHCYNSLKRDGHAFELRVVLRPDDIAGALDHFFALHTKRAELTGTVQHPDHFKSDVSRRFLRDVCASMAQRGALRIFQLCIGDRIVATRLGFVVGNSLYLYYSGYDPEWSKYGVMTTTLVEALKYAISQGFASVNLSPGTDVSKTRWAPRVVPFARATQVAPSPLSRMAFNLYSLARTRGFTYRRLARFSTPAAPKLSP